MISKDHRSVSTFSSSYDLRSLGRVSPVRNQGSYGTCWAHATFGSLESCLLPSESTDFSENNLVNLAGFDFGFNGGGNAFMSMAYLARWSGPVNEADDPYPNPGGSPSLLPVRKHVQQVRIIPAKGSDTANDELKQVLMDYGAIQVSYYHDDAYYSLTYNTYRYTGSASHNHAVTLVGWDDDFDKNKFTVVPPANGAYIVKNSWGRSWGENGFFYVSYYDTTFAWEDMFVFFNAEAVDNFARVARWLKLVFSTRSMLPACPGPKLISRTIWITLPSSSFRSCRTRRYPPARYPPAKGRGRGMLRKPSQETHHLTRRAALICSHRLAVTELTLVRRYWHWANELKPML